MVKANARVDRVMPTEIRTGIHEITLRRTDSGRHYRAYLVEADVPTLFDTGFADTTQALFDGIEAIGIEPERVVITHTDPDHVGGLAAVVERYDVETYVPDQSTIDGLRPDHRYGDGDRIGSFEAIHVPGHKDDLHALVDEKRGILVAGDALCGGDFRGLPEGYLLPHAAIYAEDPMAASLNLERLLEYDFETALVYHGSSVATGAREVLDRYVNFPDRPDEPYRQ